MFDIELINFNPAAPSFLVMLITALTAFFLSSVIAITYEFTTKSIYKKNHFLQSLALIGVVAATILQAIGESVAIGLGIIGALSIIRFRTALNDPRNMTFMFASLGVGIACGVMGFGIALTGTLVFCLGAIILRFSPWSNTNELIGTLRLRVPKDDKFQKIIEKQLKKFCRHFELDRLRFMNKKAKPLPGEETLVSEEVDGAILDMEKMEEEVEEEAPIMETVETERIQEFTYLIRLKNASKIAALEESMSSIEGLENLRLVFQNQTTKL